MRFLVDENLSPRVSELLTTAGHEAIHVRDLGARGDPDATIIEHAGRDDRVIVSGDTDFGALLAQSGTTKPSVMLVREVIGLRPVELVEMILRQLDTLEPDVEAGAIVAFSPADVRVRRLPLR